MKIKHRELPKFTLEDELAILRGLVCVAWLGVISMFALELLIRYSESHQWPVTGTFSTQYHLILAEFLVNTLVLTTLLVQRNWYERAPRESVRRLGWLLNAVIIWIGLHYFAVFHITGALQGPLALLIPVIAMLILMLFPGRQGWLVASYFIAGHIAVLILESSNLVANPGQLAANASPTAFSISLVAPLILSLLPALVIAKAIRNRLDETGSAIYRQPRVDLHSKLYTSDFLDQRLRSEINRARRQHFEFSLLVLELNELDTHLNYDAQARLRQTVYEVGQTILGNIRVHMDTPSNPVFSPNVIAILFPNTSLKDAMQIQNRISTAISQIPTVDNQALWISSGLVAVKDATEVSAEQVMNAAADELGNSSGELQLRVLPA